MKKKTLALAAAALSFAMLLSGCGGSGSDASSKSSGPVIISSYNSEPQNPLVPGNTNETGGG